MRIFHFPFGDPLFPLFISSLSIQTILSIFSILTFQIQKEVNNFCLIFGPINSTIPNTLFPKFIR